MKKMNLLIAFIVFAITLQSCKQEGCMDQDSINYDADADKDDGSCEYEGSVVFWYKQATANALTNDGALALTYYIDGDVAGSQAADVYWTGSPECGQTASITIKKSLGGVKNKTYTYSIKDQTGHEYFTGTINFTANTCLATELVW